LEHPPSAPARAPAVFDDGVASGALVFNMLSVSIEQFAEILPHGWAAVRCDVSPKNDGSLK